MGVGLIFFAFLIEMVAVHPSGIYSYTRQGYKEFKIGLLKEEVLKKVNKRKTIRTIRVCESDKVFELKSRKVFEMEKALVLSDFWICHDRTGKDFLFFFKDETLEKYCFKDCGSGKRTGLFFFLSATLKF